MTHRIQLLRLRLHQQLLKSQIKVATPKGQQTLDRIRQIKMEYRKQPTQTRNRIKAATQMGPQTKGKSNQVSLSHKRAPLQRPLRLQQENLANKL